ncbi:MAG: peptidoglycan DD-metalloendopeptidase family protein [Bacteroidales bacterium]|nr:peptidoglycan DD-metalloendopeptidase family protein [Bacteroidales bacterium]
MYRILRYIYMVVVLLSVSMAASAQDTRAQEEKKARLEREIAIIDKQLAENASQSSSMLTDLSLIRKKISNRKALVSESDRVIRQYSDSIYLAQKEINRLQARVDTLTAHYSKLVLSAYKNRDSRIWYMYMFASDNLGQAFRRFGYFRNLSTQMKNEAKSIRTMQDELALKQERLALLKKDAEAVKAERQKELDNLRKDESKADSVVKKLQKDRKKYQSQLASKKKEINALNREIERLIANAMNKDGQKTGSKKPKAPVDMKLDAEFSKNKGKLPWPADGPVVSRFGKHYHPVYKNLELPPNNGVDIALAKGEHVKAVFDGVVSQVLVMPGYNQCVLVQHGNYFTLYCKMKNIAVKAGDKVKTGQLIGDIDTINGQTQLHFEVWKGKDPQNPETWLR